MKVWLAVAAAAALVGCGSSSSSGGNSDSGAVVSTALAPPSGQQFWEGRWSPDGTKIGLHHATTGQNGADNIAVMGETGSNLMVLADAGSYLASVAWAPGGASLYFSGDDGILSVPAAGGAVSLVKGAFAALNIDLARDGKRLTYTLNGSSSVTLLDLADGGTTTLGKGEAARFSPDGTKLAYVAREAGADGGTDERFKLYKFSDKAVTDLGLAGTYLASICWFYDAKLAVTGTNGIESMDLSGTRTKLFAASAATGCDVHPDKKRILYRVNGELGLRVLSGF